jgi:hypothetical protein
MKRVLYCCLLLLLATRVGAQEDPFAGCAVRGLVGVGVISAATLDHAGHDTLGGVFSGLWIDPASVKREGGSYSGTLYGLPDRGYGDGDSDYRPRLQTFAFRFTPDSAATLDHPAPPTQLQLTNTATLLFTDETGQPFTGFVPDRFDRERPTSESGSPGGGRHSLDPEALVPAADGGWWVAEEYGPFVHRFDAAGRLQQTLRPPEAYLPRTGSQYPRLNNFGDSVLASGRRANHGFEGLARTPDGTRLLGLLQGPLVQDGGEEKTARCTRLLVWDIAPGSPAAGQPVAEYVVELPTNGGKKGKAADANELLALDAHRCLILERDNSGLGGSPGPMRYKKVNLLDLRGATNLLGTGYDRAADGPGQQKLPFAAPQSVGVTPVRRRDFLDLLDTRELGRFGLNTRDPADVRTLSEKWEGLALVPVGDPTAPDDFFLFVGNDNDFKAPHAIHNDTALGPNAVVVDTMVLVWRVTLPGTRVPGR